MSENWVSLIIDNFCYALFLSYSPLKVVYIFNSIFVCMCMYFLLWYLFVIMCLSVCMLSLGKKLTKQVDQKHIFNFVWPYYYKSNYTSYVLLYAYCLTFKPIFHDFRALLKQKIIMHIYIYNYITLK